MKWTSYLIALPIVFAASFTTAQTTDTTKAPAQYGSKGYVWNEMTPERAEILRLTGDFERGKTNFSTCKGCHKAEGRGRPDGVYPRLTGQHTSVIIKQVTDTRAGLRPNHKMVPFASNHAITLQEIADISVYLSKVQTTAESGKGPGTSQQRGKQVYETANCQSCHGLVGEGDAEKIYPTLAAQHYKYLQRALLAIKDGSRGNSHPDMVKALKPIVPADLDALADYLSRLPDYRQNTKTAGVK
jgi:cytochrome c553